MLSTPTEDNWPGVTSLPDFKSSFPNWNKQPLHNVVTKLDDAGIDLLEVYSISFNLILIVENDYF